MGLSYHKSIKIGKNTRINLSKNGGLGISTGVKGARVSVNKQGVRTSVGGHGLYYRKRASWNDKTQKHSKAANLPPVMPDDVRTNPESLRQYNQSVLSFTMKKALKWYIVVAVAALIVGAFTATVGFWVIFPIDCIVYIAFCISGVRRMFQYSKAGKVLFIDN